MTKKLVVFFYLIILVPLNVNAGIICNDGTTSATCSDCHQGCCSRHGGCTDTPNYENNTSDNINDDTKYSENNNAVISAPNDVNTSYNQNEDTSISNENNNIQYHEDYGNDIDASEDILNDSNMAEQSYDSLGQGEDEKTIESESSDRVDPEKGDSNELINIIGGVAFLGGTVLIYEKNRKKE